MKRDLTASFDRLRTIGNAKYAKEERIHHEGTKNTKFKNIDIRTFVSFVIYVVS